MKSQFYENSRFQLILFIIFVSFTIWINAQGLDKHRSFGKDDDIPNGTIWFNCTINGTTHYNNDCFDWVGRFVIWLGVGLTITLILVCCCFWYCICTLCRILCCVDQPRGVIYTQYIHPSSTYTQIP